MEKEKHNLSEEEVALLRSRWNEIIPDGEETALINMTQRLKTECRKHSPQRPSRLDLRGMNLFHEDLSGLEKIEARLERSMDQLEALHA